MTGKSFVYAYHLPSLAAIKVGHGQNPEQSLSTRCNIVIPLISLSTRFTSVISVLKKFSKKS